MRLFTFAPGGPVFIPEISKTGPSFDEKTDKAFMFGCLHLLACHY